MSFDVLPFAISPINQKRMLMKTETQTHGKRITSKQRVDLFFSRIIERQRLEEEYYSAGNAALLPEIENARGRIKDAMDDIGIRV
jgi:hypothetical protein